MTSPLTKLRNWNLAHKNIVYDKENNTISADGEVINLNESSGYKPARDNKPILMADIYTLFQHLNESYGMYVSYVRQNNLKTIIFVDHKVIVPYLKGEVDTIKNLVETKEEKAEVAEPEAKPETSAVSQSVQETVQVQKPEVSKGEERRNRLYDDIDCDKIHAEFMERKNAAVEQEIEYELLRPINSVIIGTNDFADMIRMDHQLNNTEKNHEYTERDTMMVEKRKFKNPIIIVPQTSECAINNTNVVNFLQENKWEEPQDPTDENSTHLIIEHYHTEKQKLMLFDVIADTKLLSSEDWNYVVAVFLSGFKWQLKELNHDGAPDREPDASRIFKRLNGIYVHFDNQRSKSEVDKWKVSQYEIKHAQRLLDAQAVSKIWQNIESVVAKLKK